MFQHFHQKKGENDTYGSKKLSQKIFPWHFSSTYNSAMFLFPSNSLFLCLSQYCGGVRIILMRRVPDPDRRKKGHDA
jgi:hypothetical protein